MEKALLACATVGAVLMAGAARVETDYSMSVDRTERERVANLYVSHVHRGGGAKERPDNTLETFKWCWENGSAKKANIIGMSWVGFFSERKIGPTQIADFFSEL